MPKAGTVSVSEFARQAGVSEAAVRKGIRNGRVRVEPGGGIRLAEGLKQWEQSRDISKVTTGIGRRPTVSTSEASDNAEGYGRLKTAKLAIELKIQHEEYRQLMGELVERDAIKSALTTYARLLRDKITNFGNRYGANIAAEAGADPKVIMAALDKYMRLQLEEIANTRFQGRKPDGES